MNPQKKKILVAEDDLFLANVYKAKLKKEGFQIIAIEQDEKSVDYKKLKVGTKTAFVLGNEVDGIEKKVLKLCDVIAEIPMRGKKESLNVSVATGVALFRILNI